MKTFCLRLVLLLMVVGSVGSSADGEGADSNSVFTDRLDDPSAVYLSADKFPVHGDGIADDSDALQQAINKVQDTTNQGILFLPSGRYRISRTIYIWPGIRIFGYGISRPVIVLGSGAPAFQQGPSYMIFFAGGRPGKDQPGGPNETAKSKPPDASRDRYRSAQTRDRPHRFASQYHAHRHCR